MRTELTYPCETMYHWSVINGNGEQMNVFDKKVLRRIYTVWLENGVNLISLAAITLT